MANETLNRITGTGGEVTMRALCAEIDGLDNRLRALERPIEGGKPHDFECNECGIRCRLVINGSYDSPSRCPWPMCQDNSMWRRRGEDTND